MNTIHPPGQEERQLWNKVPQVTIFFWIIKIMATTVGETAADFLNFNLNWGLTITTLAISGLLLISLYFQMDAKKYVPSLYWITVVLISVVGTLITDNLVDNLGVPLESATLCFSIALLITFVAWYASEKTLSIHSITTAKREAFYWLAILFTFALGTAAGDLVAESMNLGYGVSAVIFAIIIGAVTFAHFRLKLNAVAAFWIAYILTRPLGASLGDYLSQPRSEGGLELGTTGTSLIFIVIIFGLILYLTKSKKDQIAA
ncbi:membrane protein [Paenibacillus sp. FSL H7-0357]|uniref:COG4705 family protein n=1 Tax=unclassified Paenibacillus TaxID=185978 RepID=UPI0004F5E979|nr:membrane protein [Paenibacillus sp. FSL H7-0357]AIQ18282.1 membrane protein [Paenibacillus sp. FSL H7-0357]